MSNIVRMQRGATSPFSQAVETYVELTTTLGREHAIAWLQDTVPEQLRTAVVVEAISDLACLEQN